MKKKVLSRNRWFRPYKHIINHNKGYSYNSINWKSKKHKKYKKHIIYKENANLTRFRRLYVLK
jgi:hypothetical protein